MENLLIKCLAFVETVDRGSITRAAGRLHYAQSSVSKMIADLEEEWGIALLERGRSGVCLTPGGKQILPYARSLLQNYRELEEHVRQMNGIQKGLVRIGVFSSVSIHWLPDILSAFQEDYPGIECEMLLGDYSEVENWIEEGRVDCGFLRLPTKPGFDTVFLEKDEYMLVLPPAHPLAAQKSIRPEALNGLPFLLLEHGGKTEVSEFLEKHGLHPEIRFTTWEDFAILAMVEKGLGVGILPSLILRRIPYRVEIRPLSVPFCREIGLAMKSKKSLAPAARKFMEYLPSRNTARDALPGITDSDRNNP